MVNAATAGIADGQSGEPAGTSHTGPEQRGAERVTANVSAAILASDNRHIFSCLVCDISMTGARIQSDRVGTLPRRFRLFIEQAGLLMPCEIVWCRAGFAGLRFSEEAVFTPAPAG